MDKSINFSLSYLLHQDNYFWGNSVLSKASWNGAKKKS